MYLQNDNMYSSFISEHVVLRLEICMNMDLETIHNGKDDGLNNFC